MTKQINPNDRKYFRLLRKIKTKGFRNRVSRNGITRALFSELLSLDLSTGLLPILTTKRVFWESVIGELLWFIRGGSEKTHYRLSLYDLIRLIGEKRAVAMWGLNQRQFAEKGKTLFDGDCGRIYGAQWRYWGENHIDQLAKLIDSLTKDPYSRYHIVNSWNPSEINDMCLPPCHMFFQCFVRTERDSKYLDLSMVQRSCDMFLGVPFNILSYAMLVHILGRIIGAQPGILKILLQDVHIYEKHIEEGAIKKQLSRKSLPPTARFEIPGFQTLKELEEIIDSIKSPEQTNKLFSVVDYESKPPIKATLL